MHDPSPQPYSICPLRLRAGKPAEDAEWLTMQPWTAHLPTAHACAGVGGGRRGGVKLSAVIGTVRLTVSGDDGDGNGGGGWQQLIREGETVILPVGVKHAISPDTVSSFLNHNPNPPKSLGIKAYRRAWKTDVNLCHGVYLAKVMTARHCES